MKLNRTRNGIVAFALSLCISPALAAGFEGGYFGVSLSGFNAKTDTDHSINKPNQGGGINAPITHAATLDAVSSLDASPAESGVLGGVHGGYNWRSGSLVFGVEADLSYWGYSASATNEQTRPIPNVVGFRTVRAMNTAEASYLATLRPRLGYAFSDRSMVHVSAGLAYANLDYGNTTQIFPQNAVPDTVTYQSSTSANAGWVLGAGFEHAWSDKAGLRVDYQYVSFARQTSTGIGSASTAPDLDNSSITAGYETKVHVLRLGLSWRF